MLRIAVLSSLSLLVACSEATVTYAPGLSNKDLTSRAIEIRLERVSPVKPEAREGFSLTRRYTNFDPLDPEGVDDALLSPGEVDLQMEVKFGLLDGFETSALGITSHKQGADFLRARAYYMPIGYLNLFAPGRRYAFHSITADVYVYLYDSQGKLLFHTRVPQHFFADTAEVTAYHAALKALQEVKAAVGQRQWDDMKAREQASLADTAVTFSAGQSRFSLTQKDFKTASVYLVPIGAPRAASDNRVGFVGFCLRDEKEAEFSQFYSASRQQRVTLEVTSETAMPVALRKLVYNACGDVGPFTIEETMRVRQIMRGLGN
jgi:hypothetical protein